jgi:heptosyltransferase-3
MTPLALPAQPRILVIALRRLGDVLLTTPLLRSLRQAWPDAVIDCLVFADTAGILEGNPDIDNVVTMPARPTVAQSLALVVRLRRRYALAVSTQSGDRPSFFAYVAGRMRVGLFEDDLGGRLRRMGYRRSVRYEPGVHRVEELLRFTDALGIARAPGVVTPRAATSPLVPADDFAVIHAAPMYRYKQWTEGGWQALAANLAGRGLTVVATGGPAASERAYLDMVWGESGTAVRRVEGQLSWLELTGMLTKARLYVGPDTSVTHLAAASGCPTVALYGPTDPRLWGPWPAGGLDDVWQAAKTIQRRGNVWLVQNPLPCAPCQLEGCERRRDSYSVCLEELSAQQVLAAVDQALGARGRDKQKNGKQPHAQ